MAKNKTAETEKSVHEFIHEFTESEQRRKDSFELIELMSGITGFEAKMWGPSIIGFGSYHYKYDSGHEGDAPLIGFSPRKAALTLYVLPCSGEHEHLFENFGKFRKSKACIYVNKLSDINRDELIKIIHASLNYVKEKYV